MGRRRTRNLDLPPRLHRRGASYYYVANNPRRWIPLGRDLGHAKRLWAQYECEAPSETVETLVDGFLRLPHKWSESTRKQYKAFAKTLAGAFPHGVADVSTPMIARWRDDNAHRQVWVNGCLSLLRSAFVKAVEWGLVTVNPVQVTLFETFKRERYVSDDEFRAIRVKAPQWLQDAMELAYLTSLRESDVLALRWSEVDETVRVRQKKTGARQAFDITPELQAVLDRCRSGKVRGLFVISDHRGRPITARRLQTHWIAARTAAKVDDVVFHDIRGKAATDAKADSLDYQAMLGHSSRAMSDRYVKGIETVRAPSLRRKL